MMNQREPDEYGFMAPETYEPEDIPDPIIPRSGTRLAPRVDAGGRLGAAIFAGAIVSTICAIAWAIVGGLGSKQVGYAPLVLGFAVGWVIRVVGKGTKPTFGFISAFETAAGCVAGLYLTVCLTRAMAIAKETGKEITTALFEVIDATPIITAITENPNHFALLLTLVAIYQAFQIAWKKPGHSDEEEIERLLGNV